MSTKTKNEPSIFDKANEVAANASVVLMALAATAGLIDTPATHDKRVILPMQPAYAFAGSHQSSGNDSNTMRRERDDIAPHYVSYSAYQRTPGRSKQ